ncbi:MAG: DUF1631 domain-containing protein [Gammaproteobacteria bacterium]|nr:DUF1631 domain-containing protein [Gammaproteobacteria bacterium]
MNSKSKSKAKAMKAEPNKGPASSKALPALLDEIQKLVVPILSGAFEAALDNADTSFFQRAENGKSDNEQNLYFDAMRELRLGREDAERSFDAGLRDSFKTFPSKRMSNVNDQLNSELSLVKDDELEKDIALETMVTKASADNQKAIYHLSMRLDALVAGTRIDENNNPLAPIAISEILATAASGVNLEIRCKIILFKQFDLSVMACLKEVLAQSNAVLIEAGVLPDLRYQATKNTDSSVGRAEKLTEALVSNLNELASLDESSAGPQFKELQGFLYQARINGTAPARFATAGEGAAGGQPSGHAAGRGADLQGHHIVTSSELLDVLNNIHAQIETSSELGLNLSSLQNNQVPLVPASAVRLSIADELAKISGSGVKNIKEENEDVINLVEMLFDIILKDDYLPDTIQALISRLQIPIIKIALKDRDFFNMPRHPARMLLNELARASVGWVAERQGGSDVFLERVFDTVHAVCNAENIDTLLFEEQYLIFIKKGEKEKKRTAIIEKRTREYEAGASKSKHAAKNIKLILNSLCAGSVIPSAVNDILFEAWNKALYATYVNNGKNSRAWRNQIQIAEDLILSVQPQVDASTQARRAKLLPKLLTDLHEGLTEISFDPFRAQAFFSRLEVAHIAAFKAGNDSTSVSSDKDPASASNKNEANYQVGEDDMEAFVRQAKHKTNKVKNRPELSAPAVDGEAGTMFKNLGGPELVQIAGTSASKGPRIDQEIENMLKSLESPEEIQDSEALTIVEVAVVEEEAVASASNKTPGNIEEVVFRTDSDNRPPTAIQRQKIEHAQKEMEYQLKIDDLEVNEWFVFKSSDGSRFRVKLIEKMAETKELVFVNRRGQKEFVKSYSEMVFDLNTDSVAMLQGGSLIDRAFGSLFGKLKESKASDMVIDQEVAS